WQADGRSFSKGAGHIARPGKDPCSPQATSSQRCYAKRTGQRPVPAWRAAVAGRPFSVSGRPAAVRGGTPAERARTETGRAWPKAGGTRKAAGRVGPPPG